MPSKAFNYTLGSAYPVQPGDGLDQALITLTMAAEQALMIDPDASIGSRDQKRPAGNSLLNIRNNY